MVQTFTGEHIIGEIVTEFPKAGDLFKKLRIDFCCGGNRPLKDAIDERNLSKDEVLIQLNTLYQDMKDLNEKQVDWKEASYSELIDHIINKHHRYLNEELPQLSPYVTKVLRVHGGNHSHLARVHSLFNQLKVELEQHMIKEEAESFPLIVKFEKEPTKENHELVKKHVKKLEGDHDEAGKLIKEIRDITNDFKPPVGACGTYRLVYQRLEALESDLFEHIHLENNILFPRAAAGN